MSTFEEKTQKYVATATTAEVDEFIYPAVYDVVVNVLARNRLKFSSFSDMVTFTDKYTLPLGLGRVAVRNVFKKNRPCRWLADDKYYDVTDTSSIHYAQTFDPAVLIHDGGLYCFPLTGDADGEAEIIDYTAQALTGASTAISNFPDYLEDTVAANIAMRCLIADIAGIASTVSGVNIPTLTISTQFPQDENGDDVDILAPANLLPIGLDEMDITEDFSTTISEISSFINTDWDESLAGAKVAELNGRIQNYLTQLDGKLKKWNAEFQEYTANSNRYQFGLQRYQAEINKLVADFGGDLQAANATIQKALGPMAALSGSYQALKAQSIEQVEAFSAS